MRSVLPNRSSEYTFYYLEIISVLRNNSVFSNVYIFPHLLELLVLLIGVWRMFIRCLYCHWLVLVGFLEEITHYYYSSSTEGPKRWDYFCIFGVQGDKVSATVSLHTREMGGVQTGMGGPRQAGLLLSGSNENYHCIPYG